MGRRGRTHGRKGDSSLLGLFRRTGEEKGYMMIMVLVALTFVGILGAVVLLGAATLLKGTMGEGPSAIAFRIADAGLRVAHARIVDDLVPPKGQSLIEEGGLFGGTYRITVTRAPNSDTDYIVVSESKYTKGSDTYRRKIREVVRYEGRQAYDVMKNYLVYAGRNLRVTVGSLLSIAIPVRLEGNLRGDGSVDVNFSPMIAILGEGMRITGNIESDSYVHIRNHAEVFGLLQSVVVDGSILSGNEYLETQGSTLLECTKRFLALGSKLKVATGVDQSITTSSYQQVVDSGCSIEKGPVISGRGVKRVYVPQPDFGYYRAIAEEQGNLLSSNVLSGNLEASGSSSATVFYYPNSDTLYVRGAAFAQPNMKGVIVAEGDVRVQQRLAVPNQSAVSLQIIAKGSIIFDDQVEFFGWGASNRFVGWAGKDISFDLGFLKNEYMQLTAMRDVTIRDGGLITDMCTVRYTAPDIDILGFPIELQVLEWKEISVDE